MKVVTGPQRIFPLAEPGGHVAGHRPLQRVRGRGRGLNQAVHERRKCPVAQRRNSGRRGTGELRDSGLDLGEVEIDVHQVLYRQTGLGVGVGRAGRAEGAWVLIETFPVGPLACNCTILADAGSGEAIVIDGGDGVDEVARRLAAANLRAKYLLHTHAHIDHIGDVGALRERAGGQALLHPADLPLYRALEMQASWIGLLQAPRVVELDGALADGDSIRLGALDLDVLHTPGHTPGSVCFALSAANGEDVIFSGDTLFAGSIGRWDLGGTSMEDIVQSIQSKLLAYADGTRVVPGHGPATTIGIERNTNPYLQ